MVVGSWVASGQKRNRGTRGEAVDPVASLKSSLARSSRTLRRWCTHNRVDRLVTLTFATEPTLDAGWAHVEAFRRRLTEAGYSQPAIVPQYGSKGGRLHFHCAWSGYVPKAVLESLWPHGWVDVRLIRQRGSKRVTMSKLGAARVVAGYLSGYLSEAAGSGVSEPASAEHEDSETPEVAGPKRVAMNRRRYSIPIGTGPEVVQFVSLGLFEAWSQIERMVGQSVLEVWHSPVDEDAWKGPPTLLLAAV